MITDKQRQFDYEYEADYQSKSRYSIEQWTEILSSEKFSEEERSLLEMVYASYNHAANLLQLSFHMPKDGKDQGRSFVTKKKQKKILESFESMGEKLGQELGIKPEVDFEGKEYWWFLFFWGKNLPEGVLEFKMHPELTEAIGKYKPELEEQYYDHMKEIEQSLQIRYNQEDSVWIAAAALLYEKYYQNRGISVDDILLMQYEVQTRAQKVYGQDVNANTITQICNADERGHRFNYLRDIYKYYRVSFPGEFGDERECPDPDDVDYDAYVYSILGYLTLNELQDFISHEYAQLVNEEYEEEVSEETPSEIENIEENQETESVSAADALSHALGDMVKVRAAADVPAPQVIYKERAQSDVTDFVERTLQNYGQEIPVNTEETAAYEETTEEYHEDEIKESVEKELPAAGKESYREPEKKTAAAVMTAAAPMNIVRTMTPIKHVDRTKQGFHLYPKNTLIQGPIKTGKFHEALMTAVGIIEGRDSNMVQIEPFSNLLESFKLYEEEGRILHLSYPDIDGGGYDNWIENADGREGIFKHFANQCGEGRYVLLLEDVDLNWMHLFGETSVLLRENRREGASSETIITLKYSFTPFKIPSNLYIVATCDSVTSEDTILGAIHHDFFVRRVQPDASVLRGMRVEGILLERLMASINMRLSYFLGPEYQLGEGFFLETPDNDPFISLSRVFREQIIPILLMWLDGDMEKMRYVLGDNGKTRADSIFITQTPFQAGLFKGNLPDSFDTEMCIYRINEEAFLNPVSYIEVY